MVIKSLVMSSLALGVTTLLPAMTSQSYELLPHLITLGQPVETTCLYVVATTRFYRLLLMWL